MKKIGSQGMKFLKLLHLFLVVIFLGGIICSLAINNNLNISSYDEAYATYKSSIIISEKVVKIGAIGTLLIAFIYSIFTRWGFFRHRWITVKWVLWIAQTFIGILVVDRLMVSNIAILEAQNAMALSNPVFLQNHITRQYVVIGQIIISLIIICISVFKPWKRKDAV